MAIAGYSCRTRNIMCTIYLTLAIIFMAMLIIIVALVYY